MERIEKLLEQELVKLKNEEEREFFRHQIEGFYKDFKSKVNLDMEDIEKIVENYFDSAEEYPIYSIPVHEDDTIEYSDELKIMCPEKAQSKEYYEKVIVEEIIIIPDGKEMIEKISGKYEGIVELEKEKYSVKIRLENVEDYIRKEKELYEAFVINGVRWNPFIMPYNDKFYNVAVYRKDNQNLDEKIIKKINKNNLKYNLKNLEGKYFKNYHLMWNVSENKVVSEGYAVSQTEENMYIHQITAQSNGLTLINPDKRKNLTDIEQRSDFKVFIKTKLRQIDMWTLMTVKNIRNENRYKEQKFKLISNVMNKNMINRLRYEYKNRIRSELEIYRISGAYKYLDEIKLLRVEIDNGVKNKTAVKNKYKYINNEIMERIKDKEKDKLVLSVSYPENMEMKKDKLDYYISIIQFFFPEYECVLKGGITDD